MAQAQAHGLSFQAEVLFVEKKEHGTLFRVTSPKPQHAVVFGGVLLFRRESTVTWLQVLSGFVGLTPQTSSPFVFFEETLEEY